MPDLVDCAHLAKEGATVERLYELAELPRMKDLLADSRGSVRATFDFATSVAGHPAARVTVRARPSLVCQRCLEGFPWELSAGSEVEFASGENVFANGGSAANSDAEREFFEMRDGWVSLRELAEEELLLALPISPTCDAPLTCARALSLEAGERPDVGGEMRRPFSALQDLLKKT